MNNDYDNVPDYIKIGIENAKNQKIVPAPKPPVIRSHVPLKTKVKNLFYSIKNIATDAINGEEVIVDENVYQKRIEICMNCTYISENKTTCTQCGCVVELKAKFKSNRCPKKYW